MAKRKVEQYDGTIYGIDRHGEVARISVYRKGSSVRMSRMWPDGRTYDHYVTLPGRTARSEAVVVYNLHDIFEVPAVLEGGEHADKQLKELKEKAAKYKEELAAAAGRKEVSNSEKDA